MTSGSTSSPQNTEADHQLALQEAEAWLRSITPETASLIESAWRIANSGSGDFASDFYSRLFEVEPAVVALFPGDMIEQGQRLTHTLGDVVALVRDPRHLLLLLRATGVRHGQYRAVPAHFDIMGTVLIDVLARRGRESFTGEHRNAWMDFYRGMSTVMRYHMATN